MCWLSLPSTTPWDPANKSMGFSQQPCNNLVAKSCPTGERNRHRELRISGGICSLANLYKTGRKPLPPSDPSHHNCALRALPFNQSWWVELIRQGVRIVFGFNAMRNGGKLYENCSLEQQGLVAS
jgi:hypothetical protein